MSKYQAIFAFIVSIAFIHFYAPTVAQTPKYKMGCLFDTSKYEKVPLKAALLTREYKVLPLRISLKKYCPVPRNQGELGTCTAWAVAYAARTIIEARQNNFFTTTQITQNSFSPTFTYAMAKFNFDKECTYGAFIADALENMKKGGTVKFADFKGDCPTVIPKHLIAKAQNFKIKGYLKLFNPSDKNQSKWLRTHAVKKSLAENKPVIIGMKSPDSFQKAKNCWLPTEDPNDEHYGHAMTVIGYDDAKFGGAFEVMNSWGTAWGNQGFIWIRYQDFANFVREAYEMIELPNKNLPLPPTTPLSADLSGKLKMMTASGEEIKPTWNGKFYQVANTIPSGTKFRLFLSNNEPAYVYVFASDTDSQFLQLFPYGEGVSPALLSKKNDLAIPDEEHYLALDQVAGTDYLCVVYSKEVLDIQRFKDNIASQSGSLVEKIQKVLANKLVAQQDVSYKTGEIAFSATSKGKETVLLALEVKHK
jgi:hypothetical protein